MWIKEVFGTTKPVIGLLHLCALPGDPFFGGSMDEVMSRAKADLASLQDGGVDGVLMTNEFSQPYPQRVSHAISAAMGRVFGELRGDFRVPYGLEAIHDNDTCMELCAISGSTFTRCLFTGAWASDLGVFDKDIASTLRVRRNLGRGDLKLCYFIDGEGNTSLDTRSLAERTKSLLFHCKPECIVVPGAMAGSGPDLSKLREVKSAAGDVPVMCGTGCNEANCEEILSVADGAFVGSAFKRDGVFENPIDRQRVQALMEKVRAFRKGS